MRNRRCRPSPSGRWSSRTTSPRRSSAFGTAARWKGRAGVRHRHRLRARAPPTSWIWACRPAASPDLGAGRWKGASGSEQLPSSSDLGASSPTSCKGRAESAPHPRRRRHYTAPSPKEGPRTPRRAVQSLEWRGRGRGRLAAGEGRGRAWLSTRRRGGAHRRGGEGKGAAGREPWGE